MTASKGKVIHLYLRDPQEALERLNRITGLRFSSWPQSLVPPRDTAEQEQAEVCPQVQDATQVVGVSG